MNYTLEDNYRNAKKLLEVLLRNPITTYGGQSVYEDAPGSTFLMTTTELYGAIKFLGKADFVVERIDAGGTPRWALVKWKA